MLTTSAQTIQEASTRRLPIVVTLEHIRLGLPEDGNRCPVALALAEQGFVGYVGTRFLHSNPNCNGLCGVHRGAWAGGCRELQVPEAVEDWIRAYDMGEHVSPERFVIDLPADWPSPPMDDAA